MLPDDQTGCALIITINPGGALTVVSTGKGPYDGIEDTLLGVINNSGVPQAKIHISSTNLSIFSFETGVLADGIQTFGSPAPSGTPPGYVITTYEGPDNYFSNIMKVGCVPAGTVCGDVNFTEAGGLPSGVGGGCTGAGALESCDPNVTYFSLEDVLTASAIGGGPTGVPEPATLALFGAGLIGLGALRRRKSEIRVGRVRIDLQRASVRTDGVSGQQEHGLSQAFQFVQCARTRKSGDRLSCDFERGPPLVVTC